MSMAFVTPVLQPDASAIHIFYESPAAIESGVILILVQTFLGENETLSQDILVQTQVLDIKNDEERLSTIILVTTSVEDLYSPDEVLVQTVLVTSSLADVLSFTESLTQTILVLSSVAERDEHLIILVLVQTLASDLRESTIPVGEACFDLTYARSAWTNEAILTKGYEVRGPAFPNWGPGVGQELVTRGYSYPRSDSGFPSATMSFYYYFDWFYDRMTRLFDDFRGLSDPLLPDYIRSLNSIPWLRQIPVPTDRYWAMEVFSDNLLRHLNGGPPLVRGTVDAPFTFTSSTTSVKVRPTIDGTPLPIETITVTPGSYSARSLSVYFKQRAVNFSLQVRGDKIVLTLTEPVVGTTNSLEVLSVANDAYAVLGITTGEYQGLAPLVFDDLCREVFLNADGLLQAFEQARTAELGY